MRTGLPDLDDAEGLFSADIDGLLPAVARAGAQVRAISEAVREGALDPLVGIRPRSVVVVHGNSPTAGRAAALVVATAAGRIDVPVLSAPVLPSWIGPLDVVVLAGDDAGDMSLADAAARASRRRAELVVAAPIAGPLQDALGGNGIDLSPRVDVEPRLRLVGLVAALLAVLTGLTEVRFVAPAPGLDELADALDSEASAGHPGRDSFHNRAKSLALRLQGRSVVWTGATPAGSVFAAHACSIMAGVAGIVCGTADLGDVAKLVSLHSERAGTVSATDSIFFDPEFDDPGTALPPRVLIATTAAREFDTRRRVAALGDVDLVVGDDSDVEASPASGRPPAFPPGDSAIGDSPADLPSLLVAVLRVEMAAVYLRLVGNTAQ